MLVVVADDKDDNLVFTYPVAYPVIAILMPALGGKKKVVSLLNWSLPQTGALHFPKENYCRGSNP